MAKNPKMTVDEENEQKAVYGGMLKEHILAADSAIGKQKQESAEISGDLSAALGVFEQRGGHKPALKAAAKCARMEPAEFADYFRAFLGYGFALGFLSEDGKPAQLDMLEQEQEQERNAASIDAATLAAAKPSMGAEPVH